MKRTHHAEKFELRHGHVQIHVYEHLMEWIAPLFALSVCLFICVVVTMLNVNVSLTSDVCVCFVVSSWNDHVCDIRDYHHGPLSLVDPSTWHTF